MIAEIIKVEILFLKQQTVATKEYTMSAQGPIDIERTNLEAHVDLCAQRYESLDTRLTKIEGKFGDLQKLIEAGNSSMIKVIVGTAGTVVTGVLSVLFVLLTKH